ncbi:CENP-B homolog protein 2-like protein [Tanacetum coccineum]
MYYRKRFYHKILEGYELDISSLKKINVLDVINLVVSAWRIVQQEAIANCFRHCKIRSANPTDSSDLNDGNSGEHIRELKNLITGMHYCQKMDVNHLVEYPCENNKCYEVQSIEEIVADTIQNSVDDEVEDDSIALKPVTRKEALQAATTLHNFFFAIREDNAPLLNAMRRFKDELNIDLKFNKNK